MSPDEKTVAALADAAKIKLTDEETAAIAAELSRRIRYIDLLHTLDTQDIPPTTVPCPLQNCLREDVLTPSLPRTDILQNAPASEEGFFLVPKTIE